MKLTVRLNQIFSRLNTEHQWTTIPEYRSSLFFSQDSRMANRSIIYEGRLVREVSVLDQYAFMVDTVATNDEKGNRRPVARTVLFYEHSPYFSEALVAMKRSRDADRLRLNPVEGDVINMLNPETIPIVSFSLRIKRTEGQLVIMSDSNTIKAHGGRRLHRTRVPCIRT